MFTRLVELIAALAAIIFYRSYKDTHVRYFLKFLVYVLFVEVLGGYTLHVKNFEFLHPVRDMIKGSLFQHNYWWFSLFWIIGSALFYSFYFRKLLSGKLNRRILGGIRALYLVAVVTYILFNFRAFFEQSLGFVNVLSSFLIIISVIFYLFEMLLSDKILHFYKSIDFYISAVVFTWFLIITPIVFFGLYFKAEDWNFIFLQWQIYLSMNFFMYITFTFAIIWCRPKKK